MTKKFGQDYKWVLCLLLLVWIRSRTSMAQSEDKSVEDFNGRVSAVDTLHERNSDLVEKQHALKRILHEQLEQHVTHAEQGVKGRNDEEDEEKDDGEEKEEGVVDESRPYDDGDEDTNSGDNGDEEEVEEEEEEREFNPWQDSFQDIFDDGSYVYGYSLPNGVTHYERSYYSDEDKGRVVEGFYTQARHFGKRILYELRCYRADYYTGYKALKVQYLRRQPIVRRDKEPNVNCFKKG